MKPVNALIVHPDGSVNSGPVVPSLDVLQGIVGGYIEHISGHGWHAYCDEEGKLTGKPVNLVATRLAHAHGWPVGDVLVGTVVFLGDGPAGTEADVPVELLGLIS